MNTTREAKRMKQNRWAWVSGLFVALLLGAIFGFVVFGDSGSADGPDAAIPAGSGVAAAAPASPSA